MLYSRNLNEVLPIINSIGAPIFLIDLTEDGGFRYFAFNQQEEADVGMTTAQVHGKRPQDLFDETYANHLINNYRRCVDARAQVEVETFLDSPTGRRWARNRFSPIFDQAGNLVRIMGTVIEITEQRRVEERLRKNQEKYRALFNQSKEAIIITDTDGVIVEINQTGLALFGYRQEELVGQNITKLYLDKTTLPIQRCQHLPKNNGEKDQELLIRRKDGNACIGLFTVLALTDEEGQVYLYVVSFRDVTDKKAIENTLYFTAQLHRKDEAFFSEILQHLTTSLGISTAFIGEAHPEEKDPIRVIALYHQGE